VKTVQTPSEKREASRRTRQLLLRVPREIYEAIRLLAPEGRRTELISGWTERAARAAGVWDQAVEAAAATEHPSKNRRRRT
jgi:hypothetical protein